VDGVAGGQLHDVLVPGGVAERKVHGPLQGARLRHRRVGLLRRRGPQSRPRRGVAGHEVADEPVAGLPDGQALEHRRHPALLGQQVMDQGPHIPLRAGSAVMPLSRAYARDQRCEPPPAAAVHLGKVICHALSPDRPMPPTAHRQHGRAGTTISIAGQQGTLAAVTA
jgi:hypothetical protein